MIVLWFVITLYVGLCMGYALGHYLTRLSIHEQWNEWWLGLPRVVSEDTGEIIVYTGEYEEARQ